MKQLKTLKNAGEDANDVLIRINKGLPMTETLKKVLEVGSE